MKKLFAILLILATPTITLASPRIRLLTTTDTGLAGDALAGGTTSDTINVGEDFWGSTLDFQVVITAGTTTTVTASCEESVDGTVWVWLMHCSDSASSTCVKQVLSYDVTTTTNFSLLLELVRAPYMRCTFTGTGTGTIAATATVGSP
jgi:hypothetical protein